MIICQEPKHLHLNLNSTLDSHLCKMHLCSQNTDVHRDDSTPLLNDHLWKREEGKKDQWSVYKKLVLIFHFGPHHLSFRFSDQYNCKPKGYINIVCCRI